jgi:hypothetical protein
MHSIGLPSEVRIKRGDNFISCLTEQPH